MFLPSLCCISIMSTFREKMGSAFSDAAVSSNMVGIATPSSLSDQRKLIFGDNSGESHFSNLLLEEGGGA